MIVIGGDEHLGLVAQAAERDRMNDAVTIALEGVALAAGSMVILPEDPAART